MNYTQVPDELFDKLMARLSEAELKVFLHIIRRTLGEKRGATEISTVDFCKATGKGRATVFRALQSLKDKKLVTTKRRTDHEGRNAPSQYSLSRR